MELAHQKEYTSCMANNRKKIILFDIYSDPPSEDDVSKEVERALVYTRGEGLFRSRATIGFVRGILISLIFGLLCYVGQVRNDLNHPIENLSILFVSIAFSSWILSFLSLRKSGFKTSGDAYKHIETLLRLDKASYPVVQEMKHESEAIKNYLKKVSVERNFLYRFEYEGMLIKSEAERSLIDDRRSRQVEEAMMSDIFDLDPTGS